jgi:hypothetical protein
MRIEGLFAILTLQDNDWFDWSLDDGLKKWFSKMKKYEKIYYEMPNRGTKNKTKKGMGIPWKGKIAS